MQFDLKSFQDEAVREILECIDTATDHWINKGRRTAFSLSSMTGSGKTVIAAAVIEALFNGSDDYDFSADREPVVLWFSDNPSLNRQTRHRIHEAAGEESLSWNRLSIIESDFDEDIFESRMVYFLNTQKLNVKAKLTGASRKTGDNFVDEADNRNTTIWDTIRNTIQDEDRVLYFVLDEAHRGMNNGRSAGKNGSSIAKNLIDGQTNASGEVPPMPVVWGISATDERFRASMSNRMLLPRVKISPKDVQDSGLVKSYVNIDIPERSSGGASSVFVKHGAKKFHNMCNLWARYSNENGLSEAKRVQPLMILQIPNKPDANEVGRWIDIVLRECGGLLYSGNVFHVLEKGGTRKFGKHEVKYASPETVQDDPHIRLLIAKLSITTGWDCPRAEVLVSLRPASDDVHITQMIGRMMRAPLALSVSEDVRLNVIECVLPHFNDQTVTDVVAMLTGRGKEEVGAVGSALVNPVDLFKNPKVPEEVWKKFESIKTYSLPRQHRSPIYRMGKLAQLLAQHGIVKDAGRKSTSKLVSVLEQSADSNHDTFIKERKNVVEVAIKSIKTPIFGSDNAIATSSRIMADEDTIQKNYDSAARILGKDIAKAFVKRRVGDGSGNDIQEKILKSRIDLAALGRIEEVKNALNEEAERITKRWLSDNDISIQIDRLSPLARESFRQIRMSGLDPVIEDLIAVESFPQCDAIRHSNGTVEPLMKYKAHLYCDEQGDFPVDLNELESSVVKHELARPGVIAWYRNSQVASIPSLGIIYGDEGDDGGRKILRPDFIFFSRNSDGEIIAEVVDPHSVHLEDSISKLMGLSDYAKNHKGVFDRIQSVSKIRTSVRCLNMIEPKSRKIVRSTRSVSKAFSSDAAKDYY